MSSPSDTLPASPTPTLTIDPDGIGWLTFDDPERKLNVLAQPVMERVAELTVEARSAVQDGQLKALIVCSGKPDSFIAGADVAAIASVEDPDLGEEGARSGQTIFADLGGLPIPTVAAIHGICLGGGLEISLACDYRVASDHPKTKLGLPEVMLGILPAWGGTTRLPRLVGLQASLDMMLTGKQVSSSRALRMGLVNAVLPAPIFRDKAAEFTRGLLDGKLPRPRKSSGLVTRLLDGTPPGRAIVLRTARKQVLSKTGGHYPAPLAILDVLADSLTQPVEKALRREAKAAGELIVSQVSKNLLHVFHLREATKKTNGTDVEDVPIRKVERLGVLGAGVMGGGIGQLAANRGVHVHMKDIRHEGVQAGLQYAQSIFNKAVKRKKLRRRAAAEKMALITGGLTYDGFRSFDLVVEAVVEKLDIKKIVLRETEEQVSRECVIATNTSSLSVNKMAEALKRPEQFGGLHFFNPVHMMPLVEVVRGAQTSDETVATLYAFALAMGKVPVVTADGPGFLVNRILGPYMNEAGHLLADGASIEAVDAAAINFGMPMGPIRLTDEVGIDVSQHAGAAMFEALGERLTPAGPLLRIGETDRLGKKGGLGFYRYEKGKAVGVDPDVYAILAPSVTKKGDIDEKAIRGRLVLSMVNEAARVLEEGIVTRASDVDLAMIMGTGFPPFRGGLLKFADATHLRTIHSRLEELHQEHGLRFEPAALIADLAHRDGTFYDAFGGGR
jgi:3-hydroxyacyl-CoA dehydrogenase / enoyl-CoA hydratase / 3-hydroxybutyryl-CoA epimerase